MVSISGITGVLKGAYKYGKQILKATPELTFGTSAEKVGQAMRNTYKTSQSLTQTAQVGWKEIEKVSSKGNFLSKTWKNLKNFIPDIKSKVLAGVRLAEKNGGNKILGALKGLGKGIGKKLPFIFAAITLVTEIPNIVKATKEKGIFQGIKETIKPIVRLAGAGIGAAIGTAIMPVGGSLVGWIAGEWLAGKLVGKSYTEEQAEKEAQREEIIAEMQQEGLMPQQACPQTSAYPQMGTFPQQNPFGTNPLYNMPSSNQYADDIFMKQMNFNTIG